MDVQARLPAALVARHNVICDADPSEINEFVAKLNEEEPDSQPGDSSTGELADGIPRAAERRRADARQREIANAMWVSFCTVHRYRFTHGASEMGTVGVGKVFEMPTLGFTVPVTTVSRVCTVLSKYSIKLKNIYYFTYYMGVKVILMSKTLYVSGLCADHLLLFGPLTSET
jgi:hypothetical protein